AAAIVWLAFEKPPYPFDADQVAFAVEVREGVLGRTARVLVTARCTQDIGQIERHLASEVEVVSHRGDLDRLPSYRLGLVELALRSVDLCAHCTPARLGDAVVTCSQLPAELAVRLRLVESSLLVEGFRKEVRNGRAEPFLALLFEEPVALAQETLTLGPALRVPADVPHTRSRS